MKKISVVTICYNEENNIREYYNQVVDIFDRLKDCYTYEIIIADNASTDRTPDILREIAAQDRNFKVIFNARNFGVNRSGNNAFMQAHGDAAILMVSDLQDPPAVIPELIEKWEQGYKVVMAVKNHSEESPLLYFLRSVYYKSLAMISDVKLVPHFTGFGLYDKKVLDIYQRLNDPYPYFRGLISDIGFRPATVHFTQPARKHGKSKSNFLYLYDEAMLGITSYTKIPLRLATFIGFATAAISFLIGLFYLVYKLLFWTRFSVGTAPVTIGLFFFASVQLIFLGVIGEYLSTIYVHVLHRPLVYEEERLNF
ncbi:MAG TPA: glycosyltransferase family 2 protein [Anaerolineales bacterium]|nr:glycosyltransferase family 2 protein [Anaerolineales bacterium]